jgi:hypothetical protein
MHYPQNLQQSCLGAKLAGKTFLSTISRQSQQHWWKAFLSCCRREGNWSDPFRFYGKCRAAGHLPVTKRRIYRASWPDAVAPYRPFALTVQIRPFNLE